MKKVCPNCENKELSVLKLAGSNPSNPTLCSSCGSMFYLPALYRDTLHVCINIILPFVFFSCILLWHWWPVVAYFSVIPALFISTAYVANPKQTNELKVKKSKHHKNLAFLVILVAILAVVVNDLL